MPSISKFIDSVLRKLRLRKSQVPLRKRSDPNIPRSKSDAEVDEKNVSDLNNSGSSSDSSLSTRSLDSPSNSLEMVHKTPGGTPADSVLGFVPSTGPLPSSGFSLSSYVHQFDDSDLEAENDPPRWLENVNVNVLHLMKPEEKKRQDVINVERARKSYEESEADFSNLSGVAAESQVDGGEKVLASLQPDVSRDHAEVINVDFQALDTYNASNTKEQTEDSDLAVKVP